MNDLSAKLIVRLPASIEMVLLALAPACKSSKGEVCRCAEDCRDGLVCLVGASTVLEPGECGPSTEIGHCVDDDLRTHDVRFVVTATDAPWLAAIPEDALPRRTLLTAGALRVIELEPAAS